MERLFTDLSHAVAGASLFALVAAIAWGVLSVVLSPCHLASLPLIIGFINGQDRLTTRRAFSLASLFSVGILITIAAIGAVTAAAGRMMGDIGQVGNYLVAGVFFLIGLHLMDVISLPMPGPTTPRPGGRGRLAAFVLGLVFGVALGPCTFAFMAPMLAVTFKIAGSRLPFGILLLALYGLGHCAVIVLAGTCGGLVQRFLDWDRNSRGTVVLRRICGALVLLGGAYLVHSVG